MQAIRNLTFNNESNKALLGRLEACARLVDAMLAHFADGAVMEQVIVELMSQ